MYVMPLEVQIQRDGKTQIPVLFCIYALHTMIDLIGFLNSNWLLNVQLNQ